MIDDIRGMGVEYQATLARLVEVMRERGEERVELRVDELSGLLESLDAAQKSAGHHRESADRRGW